MNFHVKNWGEKLRRKLLGGFALTTMAFLFQACYGPPPDRWRQDVLVSGTVVNAEGEPLANTSLSYATDSTTYTIAVDDKGKFEFYTPSPLSTRILLYNEEGGNATRTAAIIKVDTIMQDRAQLQLLLHAK